MKSFNEFRNEVLSVSDNRPSHIRKGQSVFNYIDEYYNIARTVQFEKHVDCFYNDELIEEFIKECYLLLKDLN